MTSWGKRSVEPTFNSYLQSAAVCGRSGFICLCVQLCGAAFLCSWVTFLDFKQPEVIFTFFLMRFLFQKIGWKLLFCIGCWWCTVAQWLALSQQEGPGFESCQCVCTLRDFSPSAPVSAPIRTFNATYQFQYVVYCMTCDQIKILLLPSL